MLQGLNVAAAGDGRTAAASRRCRERPRQRLTRPATSTSASASATSCTRGPGADAYQGSPVGVERRIGPGVTLQVNVALDGVLGGGQAAGDDGLLNVLGDMSQHLRAGAQPPERGRGVEARAGLEDRGRRHRQDADRLQLAAGGLSGRAQAAAGIVQTSLMDFLR